MAHSEATVIKKKPHTYTKDERLEIGSRIAETLDQLDQLEIERKAAADKFKGLIGDGEGKLKKLRLNHGQGFEMREFECYVHRNTDKQMVEFVDVNSGEVIDARPFTSDDWQLHLALDTEPTGPDEGKIRTMAKPDLFTADDAPSEDMSLAQLPDESDEDFQARMARESERGGEEVMLPNLDEDGNTIPGPDTDAYFAAHPDSILPRPAGEQPDSEGLDAAMEANADNPAIGGADHDDPTPTDEDDEEEAEGEDDEPSTPKPKAPKRPANKKK